MRSAAARYDWQPPSAPSAQLLSAVAYLHDRWVMHRDLKLSNLLFTHSGVFKQRVLVAAMQRRFS